MSGEHLQNIRKRETRNEKVVRNVKSRSHYPRCSKWWIENQYFFVSLQRKIATQGYETGNYKRSAPRAVHLSHHALQVEKAGPDQELSPWRQNTDSLFRPRRGEGTPESLVGTASALHLLCIYFASAFALPSAHIASQLCPKSRCKVDAEWMQQGGSPGARQRGVGDGAKFEKSRRRDSRFSTSTAVFALFTYVQVTSKN